LKLTARAIREHFTLIVSEPILAEYGAVLRRPELKLLPEEVDTVLLGVKRVAILVVPTVPLAVSSHEEDNRFLECAEAGEADYIVTGNKRHFPAAWGKTLVVNARQFLELVSPETHLR
jgi:putative PIN family toxin of toxin-antitoxin system